MKVGSLVTAVTQPGEAVQVELALEAGIFGLIEELRHNFGYKLFGFVNNEGPSMRLPTNDGLVSASFHVIEHNMEFPRESMSK